MTKFKITLVAKTLASSLTNFLLHQLHIIEWIDCVTCTFDEIKNEEDRDFFITVLEDTSYQEILTICSFYRTAKKNTIYLSFWNNNLIIGPTHFPGNTAGADSGFLFLKQGDLSKMPGKKELFALSTLTVEKQHLQTHAEIFYAVFTDLLKELKIIFKNEANQKLKFADNLSLFNLGQKGKIKFESRYIYPLFEGNNLNVAEMGSSAYKILLSKFLHSKSHTRGKNNYFMGKPNDKNSEDEYNSVAIIGGGTAGYLTALSLKNAYPDLPVTLIESSKIPVIGVGEATTPEIRRFLFGKLKFSPLDFYEKVKPTWKLGIKFFWGQPGDYYFNYPFGTPDVRNSYLFNGNINQSNLTSVLMDTDSSFVVSTPDKQGTENFSSLSDDLQYALHLDNVSFINYLKTKALEAGVMYIDDLVIDAEKEASSNEIQYVIGESGKKYKCDFFVDCTGFKSLLIEKKMGSPYVSYNSSLFTDTAVTGCIPNSDKIKPYTYAESMNHGWCWQIPMRGEDHRGYVFSSAYCSVDEAADEIQSKNPTIKDLKTVRFKSGRHQEICIGNVFAIGNSFAFVEPLESTGIHMILKEVTVLTKNLPYLKKSPAIIKTINTHMNGHWDYLKGFLSIHYKYNKKFKTPFWKDCREHTDVSSVQWLLDLYHEVGLLSYTDENFISMISPAIKDDIFGLVGFDTILMGQGVIPKNFERSVKNKNVWDAHLNAWKAIQALTIPIESDLKFLAENLESKRW